MSAECRALIVDRIRRRGPITFAEFMELALYHPQVGYYTSVSRRSGRSGDFYTSVDVGPVFGHLLAGRFATMFRQLLEHPDATAGSPPPTLDLVEAGAGNGRLARDVLGALAVDADIYRRLRVHLVERSAAARAEHASVLGPHAARLSSSGDTLPGTIDGILFANELLDALPCHVVVAREAGLREVFVDVDAAQGRLVEREMAPSTPALGDYLHALDTPLPAGFRAEVNLAAAGFVRAVAAALTRGFVVLIDYGHEASTLFSPSHATGTLATFAAHVVEVDGRPGAPPWLRDPGSRDITAHVNFSAVRQAAEAAGLRVSTLVTQQRFLMAPGFERTLDEPGATARETLERRLALKTLLVPGGLGSTHHVMVLAKNVV